MDQLARQDGRIPQEHFEEVLIEALANPYNNWEGSRAASMAAQLLSYIEECRTGDGMQWPSENPDRIAGATYWPGQADLFADVDRMDSEGQRDAWRTRLYGPAPWKPGQDPLPDPELESAE